MNSFQPIWSMSSMSENLNFSLAVSQISTLMTGRSTPITVDIQNLMRLSKTSGSVFDHGIQNKRVDCYNSLLVLHAFPSTDSRTCKVAMVREDLQSRKVVNQGSYPKVILGKNSLIP